MNKDMNRRAGQTVDMGIADGASIQKKRESVGRLDTTVVQNLVGTDGVCGRLAVDTQNAKASAKQKQVTKDNTSGEIMNPSKQATCQQFGFSVNGFHPQWAGSACRMAFPNTSGMTTEIIPSSLIENRLNAKIEELIGRVRREEAQKCIKRKEELDACDPSGADRPIKRQRRLSENEREQSATQTEDYLARSSSCSDFSDVYSDVFVNSNVAQVIATPGGRVVACELTNPKGNTIYCSTPCHRRKHTFLTFQFLCCSPRFITF